MEDEFRIVPITHGRTIDMTGERYGRLVVLGLSPIKKGNNRSWVVKCDCGTKKIVQRWHLTGGETSSCGCYRREKSLKSNTTHGETGSRLYIIWLNMKQRCNDPNATRYSRYGARGIEICNEWVDSYIAFSNWALTNGYQDNLSIDRIDNNGNYEPSNCRWVTDEQQASNTSRNLMIEYDNQIHTISEWADVLNINRATLYTRYAKGDRSDRLFRPVRK